MSEQRLRQDLSALRALELMHGPGRVCIDAELLQCLKEDQARYQRARQGAQRVYGLTRDVGYGRRQDVASSTELSQRLLRYGSQHSDQRIPRLAVRGALLLRCRSLAVGASGITPAILELLCRWFNQQITPVLYRAGSVGAADLGEMGQLARCLLGDPHSQVEDPWGKVHPAANYSSLRISQLSARDPLALVSTNAVGMADALLLLGELSAALEYACMGFTESLVAFRGNPSPFAEGVLQQRRNGAEQQIGQRLRALFQVHPQREEPQDVQDPLSFRCYGQVLAALLQSIWDLRSRLEERINSADDNPTIDRLEDDIVSSAHFDTTLIAGAVDTVRAAVIRAALLAAERISKLAWPEFNDHTSLQRAQVRSGLELAHQLRSMTLPASVGWSGQASRGVEDWASLLPQATRDTHQALHLALQLWQLEAQMAAQLLQREPRLPEGSPYHAAWLS